KVPSIRKIYCGLKVSKVYKSIVFGKYNGYTRCKGWESAINIAKVWFAKCSERFALSIPEIPLCFQVPCWHSMILVLRLGQCCLMESSQQPAVRYCLELRKPPLKQIPSYLLRLSKKRPRY